MKRLTFALIGIFGLFLAALVVTAADVEPAATSKIGFIRGQAPVIVGTFFKNTTLRIPFQTFSNSAGTETQDLTAVVMEFRVGTSATNVPYTPTVTNATSGQGYVDITVPGTNFVGSIRVQMKLTGTNAGGTVYIYNQGFISTTAALQ